MFRILGLYCALIACSSFVLALNYCSDCNTSNDDVLFLQRMATKEMVAPTARAIVRNSSDQDYRLIRGTGSSYLDEDNQRSIDPETDLEDTVEDYIKKVEAASICNRTAKEGGSYAEIADENYSFAESFPAYDGGRYDAYTNISWCVTRDRGPLHTFDIRSQYEYPISQSPVDARTILTILQTSCKRQAKEASAGTCNETCFDEVYNQIALELAYIDVVVTWFGAECYDGFLTKSREVFLDALDTIERMLEMKSETWVQPPKRDDDSWWDTFMFAFDVGVSVMKQAMDMNIISGGSAEAFIAGKIIANGIDFIHKAFEEHSETDKPYCGQDPWKVEQRLNDDTAEQWFGVKSGYMDTIDSYHKAAQNQSATICGDWGRLKAFRTYSANCPCNANMISTLVDAMQSSYQWAALGLLMPSKYMVTYSRSWGLSSSGDFLEFDYLHGAYSNPNNSDVSLGTMWLRQEEKDFFFTGSSQSKSCKFPRNSRTYTSPKGRYWTGNPPSIENQRWQDIADVCLTPLQKDGDKLGGFIVAHESDDHKCTKDPNFNCYGIAYNAMSARRVIWLSLNGFPTEQPSEDFHKLVLNPLVQKVVNPRNGTHFSNATEMVGKACVHLPNARSPNYNASSLTCDAYGIVFSAAMVGAQNCDFRAQIDLPKQDSVFRPKAEERGMHNRRRTHTPSDGIDKSRDSGDQYWYPDDGKNGQWKGEGRKFCCFQCSDRYGYGRKYGEMPGYKKRGKAENCAELCKLNGGTAPNPDNWG